MSVSTTLHINGITGISTQDVPELMTQVVLPLMAGYSGESSLNWKVSCSRLSIFDVD